MEERKILPLARDMDIANIYDMLALLWFYVIYEREISSQEKRNYLEFLGGDGAGLDIRIQ